MYFAKTTWKQREEKKTSLPDVWKSKIIFQTENTNQRCLVSNLQEVQQNLLCLCPEKSVILWYPLIDWFRWGETTSLNSAANGHIVHTPDDMSLDSDGGMILTGENRRTRRKPCPSSTLSTTDPAWIDPGANPGLHCERPAHYQIVICRTS
jgi:hypothetical protein